MADRTIKVTLTLSASQYAQELERAKKATEGLGKSGEEAGKKSQGALDKMVTSARENRESWQAVGATLLAVGGSITAVGLAALKTGIQYNTLQQTTRAALTTLTGSAEAANAQMDKLDEFARSSPFAKQTFITAQQQMLAFGIETSRVLPYLDAVQNAVAAMGGSNQQISEVAFIMAQISAASKITGQDLMQFGQRGINAAELIGSQMGKTGAQIREDITDGALGADEALDALAAGMAQKFDGAADGVKNTFDGAMDRVKAAWRDFSSELATPLVDPNGGGGALVDLLNWSADMMRGFQALPDPIKNTTTALVGTAGVAALAAGAFLTLAPRVMDSVDAFKRLRTDMPGLTSGLGKVAGAIGVVTVALGAISALRSWTTAVTAIDDGATKMEAALARVNTAAGEVPDFNAIFAGGGKSADWVLAANEQASAVGSISDAFARLNDAANEGGISKVFTVFNESGQSWLGGNAAFKQASESIEALDRSMASLVQSGNAELLAAAQAFLAEEAGRVGMTADEAATRYLPNYSDQLAIAADSANDLADGIEGAGDAADEAAEELEAASKALQDWVETALGAYDSFINLAGAYDNAVTKNKELAQSTADATKSSKDSWEDYFKAVSPKDFIAALEEQVEAQEKWSQNIIALAERAAEKAPASMKQAAADMITELINLGPAGAEQIAMMNEMTDEELAKTVELFSRKGGDAGRGLIDELVTIFDGNPVDITFQLDEDGARKKIYDFATETNQRLALSDSAIWYRTAAETAEAQAKIDSLQQDADTKAQNLMPWEIEANAYPAWATTGVLREDIDAQGASVPPWMINADTGPARGSASVLREDVDRQGRTLPPWYIDANTDPALQMTNDAARRINNTSALIKVGADTSAATNSLNSLLYRVSNSNPTVNIGGRQVVDFAAMGRGATGGVVGYAGGGQVPGIPPADPKVDNIFARTQSGTPYAIRSGEWIINEPQSRKNDRWLRAVNNGLDLDTVIRGYAGGGQVPYMPAPTPMQYMTAPTVNVAAPSVQMPREMVVVDVSGELVGRMRVEATDAAVAVVNAR